MSIRDHNMDDITSNALYTLYSASYSGNTDHLFWTVKFGVQIEPEGIDL